MIARIIFNIGLFALLGTKFLNFCNFNCRLIPGRQKQPSRGAKDNREGTGKKTIHAYPKLECPNAR